MSILQFWFFWQRGPSLLLVMPAALSRNNDILECNFLDRKVNKIIVLVAATLVLISIVLVGLLNNLGFDNSKGITNQVLLSKENFGFYYSSGACIIVTRANTI